MAPGVQARAQRDPTGPLTFSTAASRGRKGRAILMQKAKLAVAHANPVRRDLPASGQQQRSGPVLRLLAPASMILQAGSNTPWTAERRAA